jgi:hypothetical protein
MKEHPDFHGTPPDLMWNNNTPKSNRKNNTFEFNTREDRSIESELKQKNRHHPV